MLRHIAWFNEAPIEPDPKGGLRSPDESVRRRCLLPACALEDLGIDCSVFGNLQDADPTEVSQLLQKLKIEIVVIGSFTATSPLQLAKAAKHLGCYIIADFGDRSAISEDFKKLAAYADHIVAATPTARDLLHVNGLPSTLLASADDTTVIAAAEGWFECFKALKMKPPACANTNTPPNEHA